MSDGGAKFFPLIVVQNDSDGILHPEKEAYSAVSDPVI